MACHINLLHVRYVCKTHAHSHSSICSRLPRYWFSRCSNLRSRAQSFARLHTHTVHPARSRKLSVCQRSCARFLRVRCLHAARCVPIACRRVQCVPNTNGCAVVSMQAVRPACRMCVRLLRCLLFRLWLWLDYSRDLVHGSTQRLFHDGRKAVAVVWLRNHASALVLVHLHEIAVLV